MIRLAFKSNILPAKWTTDWNNKSKTGDKEFG